MSAGHRLRQFRQAARLPTARDYDLARALLPPPLLALFEAQHPRDIVHAAATANWLRGRGHNDPNLLSAALLHDVGKGEQRRRDRAGYVLLGHLGAARAVAQPRSRFAFRRAVARSCAHSELGAAAIERAGAPPRVVELTLRHHSPAGGDAILALLQAADAAN